MCLVCVSSAFGLSCRAESSSSYTRFVSNVASVTRTDMTASGAGTKLVFARFQPSFWVLPWTLVGRQVSSIIEHNIVSQNCPKSSPSLKNNEKSRKAVRLGPQPAAASVTHHPIAEITAGWSAGHELCGKQSSFRVRLQLQRRRTEKGGLAGQQGRGILQRSAHNYNISCALLHAVPFSVGLQSAARFANRGAGRRNPWPTL